MWGLHEYWLATGEQAAKDAAERTAELLLDHRLFRTLATGEPIRPSFVAIHQPPFWHYDFFRALVVLARMGLAGDPRAADGLELLEERRLADGRWRAGGRWWKPPGSKGSNVEVVDWGSGPSDLLTLDALRVLRAAADFRSERGRAVVRDRPARVVRDLPRMAVGIEEDARVAAPERLGAVARDRRAGGLRLRDHGIDLRR